MRRLMLTIIITAITLMSPASHAGWHQADQATVAWDHLDPDTSISFKVYLKDAKTGTVSVLGTTLEKQYTVTLADEGFYRIGVSAVKTVDDPDGNPLTMESDISWSDDTERVEGEIFGVFYIQISSPYNLRRSE